MESTNTSVFRSNRCRVTLLALSAILLLLGVHVDAAPLPERSFGKDSSPAAITEREAGCTDGSLLKLKILDEQLTLKTPYGRLVIPFAKITQVECATRVPPDLRKRIASVIGRLGSEDPKQRDAATAELTRLQGKAYHALLKVEEDKDLEVRRRAKDLLKKIRESVSEKDLAVRPHDVVHTTDSKITGEIEATAFRVHTEVFGEVRLKLSTIRSIDLSPPPNPIPVPVAPAPAPPPAGGG